MRREDLGQSSTGHDESPASGYGRPGEQGRRPEPGGADTNARGQPGRAAPNGEVAGAAGQRPLSFEEVVGAEYARQREALARAMAAELGPPPGSEPGSDAELVRLWRLAYRRPFTIEALEAQMALDPADLNRHPKTDRVVELMNQGHAAEAMAVWAHPFREDTFNRRPTPREQVAEAERIARLAAVDGDAEARGRGDAEDRSVPHAPNTSPLREGGPMSRAYLPRE